MGPARDQFSGSRAARADAGAAAKAGAVSSARPREISTPARGALNGPAVTGNKQNSDEAQYNVSARVPAPAPGSVDTGYDNDGSAAHYGRLRFPLKDRN